MMTMLPGPILQKTHGRLYQGDCIPILKALQDATVDLAFADPPFNLSKSYSSKMDDNLSEQRISTGAAAGSPNS